MLNENILLYGSETLPPEPLSLRAGPLTMVFEPDNAFLRYIRLGDHELVRSIYAVVRDGGWNTIPWQVKNLQTTVRADSFDITFDVDCDDGAVRYAWRGEVRGTADGRVTFSFDGEARSDFLRNRIGICVLHPIVECAGKAVALEHTNGAVEQTSFPKHIDPWQPLKDVRAITHDVAAGVRCETRFDGEVFETEDQRNYGDASFKTYSTPQELPKPVQVKSGDRVSQRVTVTLLNPEQKKVLPVVQGRPPQVSINTTPVLAKPALGLQLSREARALSDGEAERMRALRLAHVRGDLFFAADWKQQLRFAAEQASALQLPLHLALHLGADAEAELSEFVREADTVKPRVGLWLIQKQGEGFPMQETIELARNKLSALGSNILIAAVASPFFTEMNRSRPSSNAGVLPCFPYAPQIHLTDRATLMENAADVSEMILTASSFSPQQAVISPITLKRAEPKPVKDPKSIALPPTVDSRQMSLFGAAWTLLHLSHVAAASHLHSATYFEMTGWRGVMESAEGAPLPEKFHSIPGAVFPVYHVLADFADATRVCPTHSSLPLEVAAVTLLDAQNRRRILMANLQPRAQEVKIKTGSCAGTLRRLNARNAEDAMRNPEEFRAAPGESVQAVGGKIELTLAPYEYARLDVA
jgi:D-apionolactonase